MNLLISIFGGMLLTVLLYGGARVLKLSNFWAAVAASALPSFAYVAYAVAFWPGLDVVTLHVIAYPTVAVLLFQLYGDKAGQHRGVHWAPKLMIGFFVFITVIFGGFVYIAGQGLPPALASLILPGVANKNIHTGFAGVVAHGADAAKGIGHRLKMDDKLARLGWRLEVEGLDGLRPGRKDAITLLVRGKDGQGVAGVRVRLGLGRPGQPPTETLDLSEQGDGRYRAMASLPDAGAWLATLSLEARGEQIVLERTLGGD
jgi:nitrogen fixation protein FixH